MPAREWNFDGIVGPTHNYAGLSPGNVASSENAGSVSSPRGAALQGLSKMRALWELGLGQCVLPPQERPDMSALRSLGFGGGDAEVLSRARREAPELLASCCSASSMWAANAATVSPSADTCDGRVHVSVANLVGNLHRSLESATTARALGSVFGDGARFAVHGPLPGVRSYSDEGAANHTRLARAHGEAGVELFVYGRRAFGGSGLARPSRYPARQTREACEALVRRHGLESSRVVLAQQSAEAIDAGVFHNDVISVGNEGVLLVHERAYVDQRRVLDELRGALERAGGDLLVLTVREDEVSLAESVRTYLFNSQVVTLPASGGGGMLLVAPAECERSDAVRGVIDGWVSDASVPIAGVRYFDLRESMRNGGGPACLRLRVVLTEEESSSVLPGVRYGAVLGASLERWVERRYREELRAEDLADPQLLRESLDALEELTGVLGVGPIYAFQR